MAQQEKQDNSAKKEDEEDPILAELKKRLGSCKTLLITTRLQNIKSNRIVAL